MIHIILTIFIPKFITDARSKYHNDTHWFPKSCFKAFAFGLMKKKLDINVEK